MADSKRPSAMIPLIIVGAILFAFGAYQSTRPKEPEVNKGFVPPTAVTAPANPRTMQAPDLPAVEKDAAARAAESGDVTKIATTPEQSSATALLDATWFAPLKSGETLDYRGQALLIFKAQSVAGSLTCSPALARKNDDEVRLLEKVTCLTQDGTKIEGEFEEDYRVGDAGPLQSDGELTITFPDNKVMTITKNGDEFYTKTESN
jgi:hypothetical protein